MAYFRAVSRPFLDAVLEPDQSLYCHPESLSIVMSKDWRMLIMVSFTWLKKVIVYFAVQLLRIPQNYQFRRKINLIHAMDFAVSNSSSL